MSLKKDHYVSDTGDVVYYQTDPKLSVSTIAEWRFESRERLVSKLYNSELLQWNVCGYLSLLIPKEEKGRDAKQAEFIAVALFKASHTKMYWGSKGILAIDVVVVN